MISWRIFRRKEGEGFRFTEDFITFKDAWLEIKSPEGKSRQQKRKDEKELRKAKEN
jgi:hypothetical protein